MERELSPAERVILDIDIRRDEEESLAQLYDQKSKLGQFVMIRTNPGLHDYLLYRDAQRSITEARKSAIRHEGNLVIF